MVTTQLPTRQAEAVAPKSAPVRVWAVVGAAFIALELSIFAAWLASGDAVSRPTGPTPVPGWIHAVIRTGEVLSVGGMVVFVWFVVLRPWRRTGRITLDGLFALALPTMFWQDPLMNPLNTWFTYNADFINLGSWGPHIPGWISPNGELLPQGAVMFFPAYVYSFLAGMMLANTLMRRAAQRWPGLSRVRLVLLSWASLTVFDTLIEIVALRLELWSFPGAIRGLSLFPGSRHQFPLYEAVLLAGAWTAWASLRYFRDDKGRTIAERGVDDLSVSPRARTGLRFLALAGFCNTFYLLYNVLFAITGLYGGAWPQDVLDRSYLNNGFCGAGTTYACPEPRLPIPRKDSLHVDPAGNLVGD